MPAVDLARLRKQCVALADAFDRPQECARLVQETLEYYVNLTVRTRQAIAPSSVLPSYHTPPLVLRQIEDELGPLAEARPEQALALADALWDAGTLETRLIAASLLGRVTPRAERLLARLTAWTSQVRDPDVRARLLTVSLARLRREAPDVFLTLIGEWLHPARQHLWSNGLQALLPLIRDRDYENLPPVFTAVGPVIEAAPARLQDEIAEVIRALHQASPVETTFFLKQLLAQSENPLLPVMLRRILPDLPAPLADSLRGLLRPRR